MSRQAKQRIHREHFFELARKKCRGCGYRPSYTTIWGWYEYHNAKKRLIRDVCTKCVGEVEALLKAHADPCGCKFELVINRAKSGTRGPVQLALLRTEKALNKPEVCNATQ